MYRTSEDPITLFRNMGFQQLFTPSWVLFHRSLTVLMHYRIQGVYADLEGGPPLFKQFS